MTLILYKIFFSKISDIFFKFIEIKVKKNFIYKKKLFKLIKSKLV